MESVERRVRWWHWGCFLIRTHLCIVSVLQKAKLPTTTTTQNRGEALKKLFSLVIIMFKIKSILLYYINLKQALLSQKNPNKQTKINKNKI